MIQRAVARHRRFLHLHALFPGTFISPAYDQDLVWHTHMVRKGSVPLKRVYSS